MRRLVLLLSLLAALPLFGQAYLVKDINTTTTSTPGSSTPFSFFRFGSRIFFVASGEGRGNELWSTDGTQAGTSRLADIFPGLTGSNPSRFTVVNGSLIFNARDPRGEELWITDGTSAGTRLMADIGAASSSPGDRIVYRGSMLFSADDGVNGRELWITDGTSAGTRFFKDLVPGANGSSPQSFAQLQDFVYFGASGGLWRTDGTANGTVLVKALANVTNLTAAGPRLFFVGNDAAAGTELWVSDGTEAGTRMVVDAAPGAASGLIQRTPVALGDRVLFSADDRQHGRELWISDGTAAGTQMVRDLVPGAGSGFGESNFAVLNGTVYFAGFTAETGVELWKTDGTSPGTTLVSEVTPNTVGSSVEGIIAAGNNIYFASRTGLSGLSLWVSDGTAAGTHLVSGPTVTGPTIAGLIPPLISSVDGIAWFAGANGLNGFEPWRSDGTAAGTRMIANLAEDLPPSSSPTNLTAAGDWLYFHAWDGTTPSQPGTSQPPRSMWRSDGTPEGTLKVLEGTGSLFSTLGRSLYFAQNGTATWVSHGTPETTAPAAVVAGRFPGRAGIPRLIGNTVYALVDGSLWATSTAPDAPVNNLGIGTFSTVHDVAGRAMFFVSGFGFTSLWISDGTAAGTHEVARHFASDSPSVGNAVVMGGHLYFETGRSGETKLWRSDGTFDGTFVVKTLPRIFGLTPAGRNLFFLVSGVLWVTDGTEAGTRSLAVMPANSTIVPLGESVIFGATEAATGLELWTSDGTAEGTRLVREIQPGTNGTFVNELTSIAGFVYFQSFEPTTGIELWMTDGTAEGTRLAADILPGIDHSSPRQLTRAGERLFFTASSPGIGEELWAVPLPPTPRIAASYVRVAEGNTAARFAITLSSASTKTVTVDYATAGGTATAGSDYDAASGTITFAPGETTKNVDVVVRGDASPENNETFFLALRNASNATLETTSAVAVIDDDEQFADVSLSLSFFEAGSFGVTVNASNAGPRTATPLTVSEAVAPAYPSSACASCVRLAQLAPGETARLTGFSNSVPQGHYSVTVKASQHDPNPANNTVSWTATSLLGMDAAYLTTGAQANVWYQGSGTGTFSITSSNPAVVSVPSSLPLASPNKPVSFVARGLAPGTAMITISSAQSSNVATLLVDVLSPGTKQRWLGGLFVLPDSSVAFDKPANVRILPMTRAPLSGATATGLVTISVNGAEAARTTITSSTIDVSIPVYLPAVGTHQLKIDYAGDENFLARSDTYPVTVSTGRATLTSIAARSGSTVPLTIRLTGSPIAAPTGTITVTEPGKIAPVTATLAGTFPGVAEARLTLTNLTPGAHVLTVTYPGDPRYQPLTQSVVVTDARRRAN